MRAIPDKATLHSELIIEPYLTQDVEEESLTISTAWRTSFRVKFLLSLFTDM